VLDSKGLTIAKRLSKVRSAVIEGYAGQTLWQITCPTRQAATNNNLEKIHRIEYAQVVLW
jgi:hypothetical protein